MRKPAGFPSDCGSSSIHMNGSFHSLLGPGTLSGARHRGVALSDPFTPPHGGQGRPCGPQRSPSMPSPLKIAPGGSYGDLWMPRNRTSSPTAGKQTGISLAAAPSLPAGINTDDSDPLRAGIEARYKAPLSGSVGTPLLGGVAIVSSHFSGSSFSNPNINGKPQETKEFKECGAGTPPRFFPVHPPLCPCTGK